ncbi:complex I subunit 1/NuoH family protein [Alienimonas californiensis]|uniref:NADH-quinone oxidoreductase subunit H n=1 Tax=Alienimonas californiensis TaxID=2527989 RepID=A0A517P9X7_9PLAN|nr:complex I subunit 1 family protein [Alienimonas californiensis]QDT16180.1 NADH-quinone oxidoreductase subunit 8 [Alienimonas californiensis]
MLAQSPAADLVVPAAPAAPAEAVEPVTLAGWLAESVGLDGFWALAVAAAVHAFVLLNLFGALPAAFIWLERKESGRMQDRQGPTRVGGRFGWLQALADGLKLIQKEDLVPDAADKWLFRASLYVPAISVLLAFTLLPFNARWVAVASDVGLFLILAVLSLEVVGVVLGGYTSGSKWSLLGGMREAAQMVSYEIPLALTALVPVVAAGSLSMGEIGLFQAGWLFPNWLVFANPFCAVAFVCYFVVAVAECKRAPFDLAEAESELVAGYFTEYASFRWSMFMLAEYASMFVVSLIASLLFLGAWWTGIAPLDAALMGLNDWRPDVGVEGFSVGGYLANVLFAGVVCLKASLLVAVQIWVRWSLPRLRIDQVMSACLKYLTPIACVLLLGATLWPLGMLAIVGRPTAFGATSFSTPPGSPSPLGGASAMIAPPNGDGEPGEAFP